MFGDLKTINSLDKVIKFSKSHKKNKFKLIYCPPNTLIRPISKRLSKTNIEVGAQNSHQSLDYGAFTGQVNARMLKSVGAKYVILGHSENRMAGENDKLINLKIKNSIKSGLKIIFCIGETLKQKRDKKTNQVLNSQLKKGLKSIKKINDIIIAYEPVWSIGTNKVLKTNELKKIIIFIKKECRKKFKTKNLPKVLYGGSVNQKNIRQLSLVSEIDGFLIGGASQSSKKFIDIIKNYYK